MVPRGYTRGQVEIPSPTLAPGTYPVLPAQGGEEEEEEEERKKRDEEEESDQQ